MNHKICRMAIAAMLSGLLLSVSGSVCGKQQRSGTPIWQTYDSLANVCIFMGDTITAINYFEKAAALNPGKERKQTLEKLKRAYTQYTRSFYLKEP